MHVVESGALECEVTSNQCSCRDQVEVRVAGRIRRTPEHVEHSLRDYESSGNVDERKANSRCSQGSRGGIREQPSAAQEHTTGSCHTRDRICNGHQRGVESGNNAPHCVVSADAGQGEGSEHGSEGRVWRHDANAINRAGASSHQERAVEHHGLVVHGLLQNDLGGVLLHRGRRRRGGRRPHELALVEHARSTDDHIVEVDVEVPLPSEGHHEGRDVVAVELACLS
mmetsp:Transcript_5541/g.12320  ORF Transcript_5541/g.12320 Transcript_5541/m.12320 type:complete len:226 (-) Transcript_5541:1161-1838(-)